MILLFMLSCGKVRKALPNKGAGELLSKVLQGPSEPVTPGSRIFGVVDSAMQVIKQLALENTNK